MEELTVEVNELKDTLKKCQYPSPVPPPVPPVIEDDVVEDDAVAVDDIEGENDDDDDKKGVKNAGFVGLGFAGFILIVLSILAYVKLRSKSSSSKPKEKMADIKPAVEEKEEDSDDEHKINGDLSVLKMTNYKTDDKEKKSDDEEKDISL